MKKKEEQDVKVVEKEREEKDVIAFRKKCDASGTGLSHYILMDKKAQL
ncbi:MAG: modified peptide precursor CbpA [Proteobacteria bacterium]|nr:modified peptide precursor CbpA [Pseudomonadota bacterium]